MYIFFVLTSILVQDTCHSIIIPSPATAVSITNTGTTSKTTKKFLGKKYLLLDDSNIR